MNTIHARKISLFSTFIILITLILGAITPLEYARSESSNDKSTVEDKSIKDESTVENKNQQNRPIADAEDLRVKITPSMAFLDVNHNGKMVRIQRIQDKDYKLTNSYAKTARSCPPFCIRPIQLPSGVKTVGELELLDFLKNKVAYDKGLLIDARLEDWNVKGTIPGSVNIPFTLFSGGLEDINTVHLLELLDVKEDKDDQWDFDNAIELMLFCNGAWCGQSQKAIKHLLKLGYPADKIYWYRGGMQAWQSFGLTVIKS